MRKQWLLWALPKTLTLARRGCSFSSSSLGGGVAVKRVTRANFESALEGLRGWIREADFVAIDLEMTGVTSAPWRECFEFDRSDVRYLKVKDSAEKFAVVQFGVCPFRWDPSRSSFLAYPHNFFIFPRKELPLDGPAYEFLCQTTSMDFLAKYQFDFNACIHEGISYLSRAQEAEALSKLSSAYDNEFTNSINTSEANLEIPIVSTADLLFTERIKNRLHEWRNGIMKSSSTDHYLKEPERMMSQFQTVFFKMRPAVELNGFNSHQMKLIQLVLRKHFKDLVFIHAQGEEVVLEKKVVYTDSEEDKALLMREVLEDLHRSKEARVRSAVGFRHVIDFLVSEQKLIVGHNCFLDIAHIYSKFFGPLPSSMMEFALSIHENFPNIVDTKHLLNSSHALQYLMKKSSKSLSSAFSLLCPEVSSDSLTSATAHAYVKFEVQADDTGSPNWISGAKHEAGYDAFMTGCLFAQECAHLGIKFDSSSPLTNLATNEKLQGYINRLYPSWKSGTVVDLTTGFEKSESYYKRKYPTVLFSNIVLLWGFPSKFKPKDLKDCITKVFGASSVTSIFFLDYTAALVQFSKKEYVNDFLMLKDALERSEDDPISVLHPLAGLLEGGDMHAASYDTYRQICSTSASKVLFADQAEAAGIRQKTSFDSQSSGSSTETPPHSHQVSCEEIMDCLYAARSVS